MKIINKWLRLCLKENLDGVSYIVGKVIAIEEISTVSCFVLDTGIDKEKFYIPVVNVIFWQIFDKHPYSTAKIKKEMKENPLRHLYECPGDDTKTTMPAPAGLKGKAKMKPEMRFT